MKIPPFKEHNPPDNLGYWTNKKTGEKIKFFNSGKNTNWENTLDNKLRIQIEDTFKKEMKELNYLQW